MSLHNPFLSFQVVLLLVLLLLRKFVPGGKIRCLKQGLEENHQNTDYYFLFYGHYSQNLLQRVMLKQKTFLLQFNCSTPGLAFTLTNVVFIYTLFFHQLACQYLLVEMCQLLDLITTNCKLKAHVHAMWVLLVIITVDCKLRHFSSCEKNSDKQNNKIMNTVASYADQLLTDEVIDHGHSAVFQ